MSRYAGWIVRVVAVIGVVTLSNMGARAVTANLPGGTAISVNISSPVDGAVLPEGPVSVLGTASVGTGVPVKNTTLIYVVDVSGSTYQNTGTPGRCPNQNVYDSVGDTTLDCELLAIRELNRAAIAAGTVKDIALIAFAGQPVGTSEVSTNITHAKALDLAPGGAVTQLVAPEAHVFASGILTRYAPTSDLEWVLQSAYNGNLPDTLPAGWPPTLDAVGFTQFTRFSSYGNTNYAAALTVLRQMLNAATTPNKLVVFVSDGQPTVGLSDRSFQQQLDALPTVGVKVETFAVGAFGSCFNNTQPVLGSLNQISAKYGTTCHSLPDPADAADFVPAVVKSRLTSLTLSLNSGPLVVPTLSAPLPKDGPTSVFFSKIYNLTAGAYNICGDAQGSDGGGEGSAQDCVEFTVKATPTVDVVNAGTTTEGTTAHLSATTSADPLLWSVSGGTGHCVIASPTSAETDVVCDDDGAYVFTLTANDGINPAVSGSTVLNVQNAAPDVTAPASPAPMPVGTTLTLTWPFTDPGANDTHSCSINWGDGAASPGTIIGGGCRGSHAYSTGGTFTATATVTDDNGGADSASVSITSNRAPSCGTVAVTPSSLWPPNNKMVAVALSGGSDPDGDTLSISISGITQDEPPSAGGDAVIVSGSAAQVRASRNGSGDGRVYRIAFALSDPFGGTCSGVVKVGVPHDSSGAAAVDSGATFNSLP